SSDRAGRTAGMPDKHAVGDVSRCTFHASCGCTMLSCGCGRWMHTEGIEERSYEDGMPQWFIRTECRGCGLKVGVDVPAGQPGGLVDRVMWTDDAIHGLERVPTYLAVLVRGEVA